MSKLILPLLILMIALVGCKEQQGSGGASGGGSPAGAGGGGLPGGAMPGGGAGMPGAGAPSAGLPGAGNDRQGDGQRGRNDEPGRHGRDSGGSDNNGGAAENGSTAAQGQGGNVGDDVAFEDISAEQGSADAEAAFDVFEQAAMDNDAAGMGGESEDGFDLPEASSSEERLGELDAELDVALGEFDGVVLAGRQAAIGQENSRAGQTRDSNAQTGADSGGFDVPPAPSGVGSGGGSSPSTAPNGPVATSEPVEPVAPPPEDVGDGSDDDVVARQIREAALGEKDPELREKLWDEYRKYKKKGK